MGEIDDAFCFVQFEEMRPGRIQLEPRGTQNFPLMDSLGTFILVEKVSPDFNHHS